MPVHMGFFRAWENLRWYRNISSPLRKRLRGENKARRAYWPVHVEAWQRSGLSRRRYCRVNGLADPTFKRWLMVLADAKALQIQRELDAEVRRKRRERRRKGP
ncbi:MAG: IS66 family insertion sequence element accessory protein TnpA, partial [Alphaproteobacteria bacterium]